MAVAWYSSAGFMIHYVLPVLWITLFFSGSQDTKIWVSVRVRVAKTLTYPVMCLFPGFVALYGQNTPTLQSN